MNQIIIAITLFWSFKMKVLRTLHAVTSLKPHCNGKCQIVLFIGALLLSIALSPARAVLADSVILLPIIANTADVATIQQDNNQPDLPTGDDFISGKNLFYVSKSGNNRGGESWASAWNELDQINWNRVLPGSLILIDGGRTEMVYSTTLRVKKSGTKERPITIQLAQETARNGKAVFNGGRGAVLPYCGQKSYTDNSNNAKKYGIIVDNQSWIVVDGTKWSGIEIQKYTRSGLLIDRGSSNITARNLEIFDNGEAKREGNGWTSARPGIGLGGSDHTLDRLIVHDNGEDSIQSLWGENQLRNITITRSWLHNMRRHPSVNESSNYCTHSDGVQIYDGGVISGLAIEESVIGPGFTNGVMMGQSLVGNNTWADVQEVTFRNVIFSKAVENGIYGYTKTNSQNWVLENVTLDCLNTKFHCLRIENSRHTVRNSIIYGSRVAFDDGLDNYSNNCQWNTQGFAIGHTANPMFRAASSTDPFAVADYTLPSNSPCHNRGARLTSVQHLFESAANVKPIQPNVQPIVQPIKQPIKQPVNPSRLSCSGILLDAENGNIFNKFKREAGYIVHEIDTDKPSIGGSATYEFQAEQDGMYQIRTLVSAAGSGSNSYFININEQPTGTYMIWDIEPTDGFEERMVSWRGSGTHEKNQFSPKFFRLRKGSHTLVIRGRETGTKLDKICIEKR